MLMDLSKINKLQIGTLCYASYIQLINSSTKGNCAALKCIYENKLIIIIYTTKSILKGEELLYDYTGDFRTTFNHHLLKYDSDVHFQHK